jgi:DNA-binding CsgD family transcriptional regulator
VLTRMDEVTIEDVTHGEPSVPQKLLHSLPQEDADSTVHRFAKNFKLTPKESKILDELARGNAPKRIALSCGCSLQAVYAHLARISTKTNCASYHEVVAKLFHFTFHTLGQTLRDADTK